MKHQIRDPAYYRGITDTSQWWEKIWLWWHWCGCWLLTPKNISRNQNFRFLSKQTYVLWPSPISSRERLCALLIFKLLSLYSVINFKCTEFWARVDLFDDRLIFFVILIMILMMIMESLMIRMIGRHERILKDTKRQWLALGLARIPQWHQIILSLPVQCAPGAGILQWTSGIRR